MPFSFTSMNTQLANIGQWMGRTCTWLSRDDVTTVSDITAQINLSGDDGEGLIHLPIASVANPLFGDKITAYDATEWRIMEVLQENDVFTPCRLKAISYWKTIDIEEFAGGSWGVHTANVPAMIEVTSSTEDFDEFNDIINEYTVRLQYLSDPTQKMRFKFGTRYLYINGILPDDSRQRWLEVTCREDEA